MAADPKRVAAGKKSKRKGDTFEREIALDLNKTYAPAAMAGPLIDRPFRRTPLSGGFRSSNPADIMCPPWFPFFIECKHRKDIDTAALLFNMFESKEKNYLIQLWHSEKKKTHPLQKELLIVFKKTMSHALCLTRYQSLARVDVGLSTGRTDKHDIAIRYRCQGTDLVVVTWEAFLRRCSEAALGQFEEYLRLGDGNVRASNSTLDLPAKVEAPVQTDVRERYGLQLPLDDSIL